MSSSKHTCPKMSAAPTKVVWSFSFGSSKIWIEMVPDFSLLEEYQTQWEDLARNAAEPNVFHEPRFLIPAWKYFGTRKNIFLILIFLSNSTEHSQRTLLGLFPIEMKNHYAAFPIRTLSMWVHPYCYNSIPRP